MFHQANAALEQHRVFQLQLAEKAQETRLTPKGVLQSAFAHQQSLPVQPFVVLLVDGDSYGVSPREYLVSAATISESTQCLRACQTTLRYKLWTQLLMHRSFSRILSETKRTAVPGLHNVSALRSSSTFSVIRRYAIPQNFCTDGLLQYLTISDSPIRPSSRAHLLQRPTYPPQRRRLPRERRPAHVHGHVFRDAASLRLFRLR